MQGIVLTASEEFSAVAGEELRRLFPKLRAEIIAPGILWLPVGEAGPGVQEQLLATPPIFVRHLHAATVWSVESGQQLYDSVLRRLQEELPILPAGVGVAVQARASNSELQWEPRRLKSVCDELLQQYGYHPTIKQPQWVVSVTQAAQQVYYGLAEATRNLSDWSGGMIHFRKDASDVSRAKFKLLEAIVRFGLDWGAGGSALDLGAAPGGWTQELLTRGFSVVAVDTGDLDPRLHNAAGLRFLQQNVRNLHFPPQEQFDLITCDMSWDPIFTVQLMNRLVGNLRSGGQVIMTVKLMGKQPLPLIQRVMDLLDKSLVVAHAQHLWHNRQEITLHLVKK